MKTGSRIAPRILFHLLILLGLLFLGALLFLRGMVKVRGAEALPVYGQIPDAWLIDSRAERFDLSQLRGKVWIADFVFTHCAGPCPMLSARMKILQQEFSKDPRIALVSFSVDPERDTPEVLERYGRRFGADFNRWFFLTGDKNKIYSLLVKEFHLGVEEVPTLTHSTKLALVDTSARIRGYYECDDPPSLEKLIRDARQLLKGR